MEFFPYPINTLPPLSLQSQIFMTDLPTQHGEQEEMHNHPSQNSVTLWNHKLLFWLIFFENSSGRKDNSK